MTTPPSKLNRILYNNHRNSPPTQHTSTQNTRSYSSIPYTKQLSEQLSHIFLPNNIRLAHKPTNLTQHLYCRHKTKPPERFISNVVYKITCNNCPSVYIGQTKQYLHKRIQQHKYSCTIYRHKPNDPTLKHQTALTQHAAHSNHSFDFNNTHILEHENNFQRRLFLESTHIQTTDTSINLHTDTQFLSATYKNLLTRIKRTEKKHTYEFIFPPLMSPAIPHTP